MPKQQWAYGILFPLDHAALSGRSDDEPCVVRVKLVVEGGIVGVAACNSEGLVFTAPETVVGGASEILMTLTRPTGTGAIVVRKISGADDVAVTIVEIGLFEAGEEGLAPRRHDLGFDLFVILSAAKTGTQTIESALYSLSPFVRLRRVHFASAEGCLRLRNFASEAVATFGAGHMIVTSNIAEAEAGDLVRAEIAAVRRLGGNVAFVTAVRDPIARTVANMFHSLPHKMAIYAELYDSNRPLFAQMLAEGLIAAWKRELQQPRLKSALWSKCLVNADYLRDEFCAVTGFDPLLHDFDRHVGYARLKRGNDVAVVFRTSELDRTLSSALAGITGRSPN
ncbi:MAG: hypothetical protein ACRD5Z_25100, partial [Bryobacteraceae bacterium]